MHKRLLVFIICEEGFPVDRSMNVQPLNDELFTTCMQGMRFLICKTGSFHVKSITFWQFLHHPTPNLMKFSTVVGSHEYIKIKNKIKI